MNIGPIDVASMTFFIGGTATGIIFLFSTFATIKYVDNKHTSVISLLLDLKKRMIRLEDHLIKPKGE